MVLKKREFTPESGNVDTYVTPSDIISLASSFHVAEPLSAATMHVTIDKRRFISMFI